MYDYDIAIIGGGPAGYVAASYASQHDKRTVLIEKDKLGGCCLNTGCIPTKVLYETSRRYRQISSNSAYGIVSDLNDFSWETLKGFSEKVRSELASGVNRLLRSRNVEVIYGEAAVSDGHTVCVGGRLVSAGSIILAMGSKPVFPSAYNEIKRVVSSDSFWDINERPGSIVIVGGGVIGCEIASALSGLGVKVSIVEQMPNLLPQFSREAAGKLESRLKADNADVYCDHTVTDIAENDDGLTVTIRGDGQKKVLKCDHVLWAAGRKPNTEITEGTDIEYTDKGYIKVDDSFRTSVDSIFCIGDANGISTLAYTATAQAMSVIRNICTMDHADRAYAIPMCVYTYPEIAGIGLSEEDCNREGLNVAVGYAPYKALGYAHAVSETDGHIKVLRDIETDTIVGAEIVGTEAVELIHVIQPYIERRIPLGMLGDMVMAHPTFSEGIKLAVESSYIRSPQL